MLVGLNLVKGDQGLGDSLLHLCSLGLGVRQERAGLRQSVVIGLELQHDDGLGIPLLVVSEPLEHLSAVDVLRECACVPPKGET